jgi:glycosyltransferase involved in cell wall biosynthesis
LTDAAAVAVVIPAHNEERLIGACLASVRTALASSGLPATIVVVAHRCTDRTEDLARQALKGADAVVLVNNSPNVATARSAGAVVALARLARLSPGLTADRLWLLSTDADSAVPPSWVEDLRRHLDGGAAAIAGLVSVHGWEGAPPAARAAYRKIIAAGIRGDQHDHVYAANLAVRADAYLDVGGWPDCVPGEDAALLGALRRGGWPVTSGSDVWVRTSGRRVPRAEGGLGTLLNRLALTPPP